MIYGNKFLDKELVAMKESYDNFYRLFPECITESTDYNYQQYIDILNEDEKETKRLIRMKDTVQI